jgi:transposase
VTAPDELREQLRERKTNRGRATLCARLRPDLERLHEPLQAAKLALRSLARRVSELDQEIAALDAHLEPLVATAAPRTTQLLAISTGHAGQLLVTAGENIDRLRLGRALRRQPDPRRLRPPRPPPPQPRRRPRRQPHAAHDRRLPPALLRTHPRLRRTRTAEGKTKPEIIRCLKRYIAREIYHALSADLAELSTPEPATPSPPARPAVAISINCGAGPIGRTRRRT